MHTDGHGYSSRGGWNVVKLQANPCASVVSVLESVCGFAAQELFLFLVARLRGAGQLPPPREFSREQIEAWIADDEEGMRRFREGR
jgi:hypothetical protein